MSFVTVRAQPAAAGPLCCGQYAATVAEEVYRPRQGLRTTALATYQGGGRNNMVIDSGGFVRTVTRQIALFARPRARRRLPRRWGARNPSVPIRGGVSRESACTEPLVAGAAMAAIMD